MGLPNRRHNGCILLVHKRQIHDDVIKWKHFPRNWPSVRGIHRSPVNSPHKGQWRGALMFSLICVWINTWVNNREAGDLRRYHAHCDVTVMNCKISRVQCILIPIQNGTECEPCPDGTYNTGRFTTCLPHSNCSALYNRMVLTVGDSMKDNVCGNCRLQ